MRLSKRQLKRIIREEYSRLKRRGLIREMSQWQENPNMIGQEYYTSDMDVHAAADQEMEAIRSDYGQDVLDNLCAMNLSAQDIDDMAGGWGETIEEEAIADVYESMDLEGSGNYAGADVAQAIASALKRCRR